MSDVEHEFVVENAALRALAARAIDAAIAAQHAHGGTHETWLDDARRDLADAAPPDSAR